MTNFEIKYEEMQERLWTIIVQAESLEEAEELFKANGEDPWRMVDSKKATWAWDSSEDGEAVDTYETNWEIEETV
jgi:hypothetical protein